VSPPSAVSSEIATVIKWLWSLGVRAENLKQTSPEEEEARGKEKEEEEQQRRLSCFCLAARESGRGREHAALFKKKGREGPFDWSVNILTHSRR